MRDSAERKFCKQIEVWSAVWAERYQLSIDHRVIRKTVQCRRNVMELLIEHVLPARVEGCFAGTPHDLKPVAIQLDFIGPSGPLWEVWRPEGNPSSR